MGNKKEAILNIGCGNKLIDGAVNLDKTKHRPEVDVVHDLNDIPWPFDDESFDLIVARAVLEHLDIDLVASVNEAWRILRPSGELYLKLPYWQADTSYADPTHRWHFSPRCCELFDPSTEFGKQYGFYTQYKWKIVKGPRMNDAKTSIFIRMRKIDLVVNKPKRKRRKSKPRSKVEKTDTATGNGAKSGEKECRDTD